MRRLRQYFCLWTRVRMWSNLWNDGTRQKVSIETVIDILICDDFRVFQICFALHT